ncbi:MAG: magnesium transporter [Anaerolineae bacterium]|nr:magnesium transporter [Anaerolineae bacterium]
MKTETNERRLNRENTADKIREAIGAEQIQLASELFLELHLGDQVGVFNLLDEDERGRLLSQLDISATAHLFSHQDDSETLDAAENLSIERLADVLDEMQPDEAADLLGDLPPKQAFEVLEQMEDTEDVLPLLKYADETAGGRMTTAFISMRQETTSEEAINLLREVSPGDEAPYYLFVTEADMKLAGVVQLRELVVAGRDTKMGEIMDAEVIAIAADADQEDVARVMKRYDLSALPVVDDDNHLVGVITHDDILDVLTEEATEDIYRLANVADAQLEPASAVGEHLKGRLPWLYLNTLTALFASWVISHFEGLISQIAVLAVFQSIVAGQGGNAASQNVALVVRGLALGNIPRGGVRKILVRQAIVGLVQGIAIGVVVGIGVALWRENAALGIVLGLALVANMVMAGIIGTLIPLGLKALGQDPALASSVLVTAVTDSFGFFIFLSLATIFMKNLM